MFLARTETEGNKLEADVLVAKNASDQGVSAEVPRLRLLLDKLHGERLSTYEDLVNFLSERCQVTILKKKPLDLKLLTETDVFMLISPGKSWEESEVETVRTYVEGHGRILIAMTLDGRKPQHLNKLLEPYELSVIHGTVGEAYLDRDSTEGPQLLEGVELLALGKVWGYESARIAASNEAEVVLQYKDAILGAKRSLQKGIAYLFSCLPAFGNKQLHWPDNRIFLDNLLECLATPSMVSTLSAIARDKSVPATMDVLRQEGKSELYGGSEKYCIGCIYNEDYRRFDSSMLAFFSPIATNYDVCVLKWRRTVSPCKFFDRIGRKYKEIDVSQVRATVLDLNDQTGLQLVDNFEREKSPLALVRLQQFLEARGYQIDRISQQNVCIEYYRYYPIGPLEKVDQKQG